MLKRSLPGLIMLSFILIFSGCGSGSGEGTAACGGEDGGGTDAPATSTITIGPATDVEITDGTAATAWSTQNFHISVKTALGIPLSDVNLYISYIWAVPNGNALVQLYDCSTAKNSPMMVKTDINGTYNLRFDFQSGGGLEYSGNLQVVSGSVIGSRGFAVSAGE